MSHNVELNIAIKRPIKNSGQNGSFFAILNGHFVIKETAKAS